MKKVKIVRREEAKLADLIREAKGAKEISECGAMVAFIGFVRERAYDGSKVKQLYYEAYGEKATETLRKFHSVALKLPQLSINL